MEKKNCKINSAKVVNIVFLTVVIFLLSVYSISMILTLGWGLLTSLKSSLDFQWMGNVIGLPDPKLSKETLLFDNYKFVFENLVFTFKTTYYRGSELVHSEVTSNFWSMLINTILYAGVGAFILAIVPCIVSYVCAKYRNKVSSLIYFLVVFTMAMPVVGTTAADLTLVRNMGLYNSFLGNWIQKFYFNSMYFLVFYAFFEGLSDAYIEAAEIDGASQARIMLAIALPLASKIIVTVTLIQFVTLWNDYQTIMLYMPTYPTLAYAVYELSTGANSSGTKDPRLKETVSVISSCMLLAIPTFTLFLVFRDKLMGNISMGGVKE